jgi:hypothetical protein
MRRGLDVVLRSGIRKAYRHVLGEAGGDQSGQRKHERPLLEECELRLQNRIADGGDVEPRRQRVGGAVQRTFRT